MGLGNIGWKQPEIVENVTIALNFADVFCVVVGIGFSCEQAIDHLPSIRTLAGYPQELVSPLLQLGQEVRAELSVGYLRHDLISININQVIMRNSCKKSIL
jgi:hypothetical protein